MNSIRSRLTLCALAFPVAAPPVHAQQMPDAPYSGWRFPGHRAG